MEAEAGKRVVCIGGGHVNCQVMMYLKDLLPAGTKLTLVSEDSKSFYSGMLPGSVAQIYDPEQITIHLDVLAKYCEAEFIKGRVKSIKANSNQLELENGEIVPYDYLAVNTGSRTMGTFSCKGVWENALTTRPINYLLGKIENKEKELIEKGITPRVVVCGAGCAGVELSMTFKQRWSELFGKEIEVAILTDGPTVLWHEKQALVEQINRKLAEKNVVVHANCKATEITKEGVHTDDGRFVEGNVFVWSTGAEAQPVTQASELEMENGYFRVNDFMQSTSHPNVFCGGDCACMASYAHEPYPPKAGVFAVRQGPIISQNIPRIMKGEELVKYVPQREFLALLAVGDKTAVGTKFGISFVGKWVWNMKDYIDLSFMRLFYGQSLFADYAEHGTTEQPNDLGPFNPAGGKLPEEIEEIRKRVQTMPGEPAGKILSVGEEEEDFYERLFVIQRMHNDQEFRDEVIKNFKPPY